MEVYDIINAYIDMSVNKNNVDAVVLSGSKTSSINDEMSDYDIYVYSKDRIDIDIRKSFADKYASYSEIGSVKYSIISSSMFFWFSNITSSTI